MTRFCYLHGRGGVDYHPSAALFAFPPKTSPPSGIENIIGTLDVSIQVFSPSTAKVGKETATRVESGPNNGKGKKDRWHTLILLPFCLNRRANPLDFITIARQEVELNAGQYSEQGQHDKSIATSAGGKWDIGRSLLTKLAH